MFIGVRKLKEHGEMHGGCRDALLHYTDWFSWFLILNMKLEFRISACFTCSSFLPAWLFFFSLTLRILSPSSAIPSTCFLCTQPALPHCDFSCRRLQNWLLWLEMCEWKADNSLVLYTWSPSEGSLIGSTAEISVSSHEEFVKEKLYCKIKRSTAALGVGGGRDIYIFRLVCV